MTGGRNKPWLLTVQTESGPSLYVTKFFVQQDIDQQNALCREIYTGALANEFELDTPDFALITIDDAFRETLSKELSDQLSRKHTQYGFGSEFIPGNILIRRLYSPEN